MDIVNGVIPDDISLCILHPNHNMVHAHAIAARLWIQGLCRVICSCYHLRINGVIVSWKNRITLKNTLLDSFGNHHLSILNNISHVAHLFISHNPFIGESVHQLDGRNICIILNSLVDNTCGSFVGETFNLSQKEDTQQRSYQILMSRHSNVEYSKFGDKYLHFKFHCF